MALHMIKLCVGVAKVETVHSFVNQLVGAITFGIFTPMSIKVTCAGRGRAQGPEVQPDVRVGAGADEATVRAAMEAAADRAVSLKRPVFVQF